MPTLNWRTLALTSLLLPSIVTASDSPTSKSLSWTKRNLFVGPFENCTTADLNKDGHAPDDIAALRPSLLLAVAHERAKDQKPFMDRVWRRQLGVVVVDEVGAATFAAHAIVPFTSRTRGAGPR